MNTGVEPAAGCWLLAAGSTEYTLIEQYNRTANSIKYTTCSYTVIFVLEPLV